MRFEAEGPDIPLGLLEARDRGEVVFLCGAGISIPAGMPNFRDLALQVVRDLGVPAADPASVLLNRALAEPDPALAPPMDQVFGVLQRDYGIASVEAAVARLLSTKRSADLGPHRTVLRLSAAADGVSRVITTNFDWLFERAEPGITWTAPPGLPDLAFGRALQGITYLHGRLNARAAKAGHQQGLVIGSADFGRAYLAEGWATQFVRQILDQYVIVLLGYSADDPPMRYLLEGSHVGETRSRHPIYTFSEGNAAEVEARWRQRGVTAIAYRALDVAHSGLWRSLDRWADRAADPIAWRSQVIAAAAAGPRVLAPYQRGQVAAVLQSPAGAKAWAEATPPPPAEWLCVLDNHFRYARSGRRWYEAESETFDPYETWRLDSDPPRPGGGRDAPVPGLNLLRPTPAEDVGAEFAPISVYGAPFARLSPRLLQLAWWFGRVALEPTALWWAAGQRRLHPTVQEIVERELNRPRGDASLYEPSWRLLLEAQAPISDGDLEWYSLHQRIRRDGWTNAHIRLFSRALIPRLKWERPFYGGFRPPVSPSKHTDLIEFEVVFQSARSGDIAIPDEVLSQIVSGWREALLHGVSFLNDIQPVAWETPTLIPEERPGERYPNDVGSFFLRFAELFDRLVEIAPSAGRRELEQWPSGEPFFFDKLRTWAARRSELVEASSAERILLGLDDDAFWAARRARELLFTLRDRWSDLSEDGRRAIEDRIIAGPLRWEQEDSGEYEKRRGREAATRLGWLLLEGQELSPAATERLPDLRAADARWSPEWDAHAADSLEGRSGWVRPDLDPGELPSLPLSQIAHEALAAEGRRDNQFVSPDPFRGLLEARPARALAALTHEARHGRYEVRLWTTLLDQQEPTRTPRLTGVIAGRLAKLPQATLVELRFSSTRWLERNIAILGATDVSAAWSVWDAVLAALMSGGPDATKSGLGDTYVGGEPQERSRRTYDMAINGPVGALTQAALTLIDTQQLATGGIATDARARLAALCAAPGEGSDNAVSVLFRYLIYFDQIDEKFAAEVLAPMLNCDQRTAEPAWSGYLAGQHVARPELFRHMRHAFLDVFRHSSGWRWSEPRGHRLAEFLIAMLVDTRARRYLRPEQARSALQQGGEPACLGALHALTQRMSDHLVWLKIKRIILSVWPNEARLQTRATSQAFVDLVMRAKDDFPDAVRTCLSYLKPIGDPGFLPFRLLKADDGGAGLAERFPRDALSLLNATVGVALAQPPYQLREALDCIAAADPSVQQSPIWRKLIDMANPR